VTFSPEMLPQTDSATCCQSRHCLTTAALHAVCRNSCRPTTNPQQIKAVTTYNRSNYVRPATTRRPSYMHGQRARPKTTFVDHTIDLPWRNFLSAEFGTKFQREEPYILKLRKVKFYFHLSYGASPLISDLFW